MKGVVPSRQRVARDAHRGDDALVADFGEPERRAMLDEAGIWLLGCVAQLVDLKADMGVAVEGLRDVAGQVGDLCPVDPDVAILDPDAARLELLRVCAVRGGCVRPIAPAHVDLPTMHHSDGSGRTETSSSNRTTTGSTAPTGARAVCRSLSASHVGMERLVIALLFPRSRPFGTPGPFRSTHKGGMDARLGRKHGVAGCGGATLGCDP